MIMQLTTSSNTSLEDLRKYDFGDTVHLDEYGVPIAKGGVAVPFPWRLHECLDAMEKEGLEHIISWKSHGRAFIVLRPGEFEKLVLPRFFNQTRYSSFQRQLNIYGFTRMHHGLDRGCYYNMNFVRGQRSLVRNLRRMKIKGTKGKKTEDKDEPNFYLAFWGNAQEVAAHSPIEKLQARPTSPVVPATAQSSSVSCVSDDAQSGEESILDLLDPSMFTEDEQSLMPGTFMAQDEPIHVTMVQSIPNSASAVSLEDDLSLDGSFREKTTIQDHFPFENDMFAPIPLLESSCGGGQMQLVDPSRNLYNL